MEIKMATRKKKSAVKEVILPTDPSGVVKGNHLTVITFSDGRTELQWDDEALLKEVQDAILSVELAAMKPAVRAKVATRKRKESNV